MKTVVISWDPAAKEGGRNRILEIDNDESLGRRSKILQESGYDVQTGMTKGW